MVLSLVSGEMSTPPIRMLRTQPLNGSPGPTEFQKRENENTWKWYNAFRQCTGKSFTGMYAGMEGRGEGRVWRGEVEGGGGIGRGRVGAKEGNLLSSPLQKQKNGGGGCLQKSESLSPSPPPFHLEGSLLFLPYPSRGKALSHAHLLCEGERAFPLEGEGRRGFVSLPPLFLHSPSLPSLFS